jgi:hypothetical protein
MFHSRLAPTFLAAGLLAVPGRADAPDLTNSFTIPGTETRLKFYGKVQVFGQYYFDQYLYDNGTLIGGEIDAHDASATPDRQFSLTARTSGFGLVTGTPTRFGTLTTNLELAFSAGKPSARGNPKMNQAWIGLGGWLAGYTWSNWINLDAQPDTVDASGPVGQTCNDTGRYTQVRYTWDVNPSHRLSLSAEANQRAFKAWSGDNPNQGEADTIQQDARYPSLVGAYVHQAGWGQLSLRALTQQYGAYRPPAGTTPAARQDIWGSAVQVSGTFPVGRRDKLVYSAYTGEGVGVYGFNPQAVKYAQDMSRVWLYPSTGWQVGYTHRWTGRLRSNLIATGLRWRHSAAVGDTDFKQAENYFVNTIVQVTPSLEVGLEYGYEGVKTFGAQAITQRDGSKGGTNKSNKLQLALTAKF